MASRHSGDIGCSLIVSRSNTCLTLFKINTKVDLGIRKYFLNRATEYVFQTRSHQPVIRFAYIASVYALLISDLYDLLISHLYMICLYRICI